MDGSLPKAGLQGTPQGTPLAGEGHSLTAFVLAQCLPGGLVAFYALATLGVFTLYI